MELVRDVLSHILLAMGAILALTGAVGVVRMPDFFTRLHPAGKTDTFGQACVLCGLAVRAPDLLVAAKLLLLVVFVAITAPTATHAITRAAWLDGLRPWEAPRDTDAERDATHG